jgi:hypothetical protein
MRTILTTLAATSALALFATAANADCYPGHKAVSASADQAQESVAVSTYDGTPPALETETKAEPAKVPAPCAEGEVCEDATK